MIRRVMGGVGANIFDKLVVTGTQLAMVPVMAGSWGLHLYGLWVLMFTAPSFLAMGDFGFAQAAGTKMTMAVARGQRDEAVHIFQSAWIAILLSSALLVFLTAALALLLPAGLFGSDPGMAVSEIRLTLFLLMFYGIAAIQGSIFFAAFRAAGMFAVGAFWNAVIIMIESTAVIAVVLMGETPIVAALTILCGRLVGLAGQNILLRRRVPWLRIGFARATWEETKSLFAPAGAVMMVPVAQAFYLQGTALALGAAAGQAAVPAFTAVRTLSRVGLQMCWLVNTPLMPEFSSAHARGDRRAQALIVLVTTVVSSVLIIPYALLFGVLAQPVVKFWTHGVIHSSQSLIWAMAGGILFGGFWFPLSNLILALNRHASYTGWFVLFAGLSLPLTYSLAKTLGPTGAGLSMFALEIAMFSVVAVLARRILLQPGELRSAVPLALRRLRHPFARSEAPTP